MGNLINEMKQKVKNSGSSKKEVLYFAPDSTKRIRFLEDLDAGRMVQFHSDYENHIYEICKDPEDHEDCEMCKNEVQILEQYVWNVWDYDSNAVRLLCVKATGISPIPALIELFEEYGTLLDRDLKIKKVGKGVGGSFAVTPLDKSRFRNNAKPYSDKKINEIFLKAFGTSPEYNDDDEDDDEPKKKSKKKDNKKSDKKSKKKEPSLREKYEELEMDDLREICLDIGMSKKEINQFDDEEEILDELFDNYEESDLEELLENVFEDDDEDEDEDDE